MPEHAVIVDKSTREAWCAPGGRDTQEAEIAALEAKLKECPHCACREIHLHGIDSYGYFHRARCSHCGAETRPEVWNQRVQYQLSLFEEAV